MTEREIFLEAMEIATPKARAVYLDFACGQNLSLRHNVDELLKEHFSEDDLLRRPAAGADRPGFVEFPLYDAPSKTVGRYKLLEKIGEGGMGEVWMAEQDKPVCRRVALKLIKVGMDTRGAIARFEAEGQALALMDHPNIAKVLDAGTTGDAESSAMGRPYLVMELVRGIKITEFCDQHQLSTHDRIELFIKVCQAIQHAHQKGIIHRDIKPSNILITVNDGVPVPKVIDFGIAKAIAQKLTDKTLFTEFQALVGTPAYMSPEQTDMTSVDVDTRSDIYSLGVLLYELLVGQTPFDAKEMARGGLDMLRQLIREKDPVKPSTKLKSLPGVELTTAAQRRGTDAVKLTHQLRGDVDWIVMKCLEKDRARRYETANGLAADLKRHLAHEPVVARPPSTAYRFQKFARRNKLAVATAAIVMAALLLGGAVSTWQAVEATRARKAERQQLLVANAERDRAQTAGRLADQQRQRAETSEAATRSLLYAANINLAAADWDRNTIHRLTHLLKETDSYQDKGFEWYYWMRQLHRPIRSFHGHLGPVSSLAFSPDGQRLVTGGADGTARIWDAANGQELFTLRGHFSEVNSVLFSPDASRVVTASGDQTARLWDATTGRELTVFQRHPGRVICAAISPDGARVVTGCDDGFLRVWDSPSGHQLQLWNGAAGKVHCLAISPDGSKLVSGHPSGVMQIWELDPGRNVRTTNSHGVVAAVAISPDGQRIASGTSQGTVSVHDLSNGEELFTWKGHPAGVNSIAYSQGGHRIITGSMDQTAALWNAADGEELGRVRGHSGGVHGAVFSADGLKVATASADGSARIWDAQPDRDTLQLGREISSVLDLTISPDGRRVLIGTTGREASVWDSATGRELFRLEGHTDWVPSVAYSPDGRKLATACFDRKTRVYDAATGRVQAVLEGHFNRVNRVAFSPDSQRIATASYDGTVKIWNAETDREELTLRGPAEELWCLAFSPDGERIAAADKDGIVHVWNAKAGEIILSLKAHPLMVTSVLFSPDGTQIVTTSLDRTAKVWAAATGQPLLSLEGHTAGIVSASFLPDQPRIVTAGADNLVKVWDAATGRELLSLRCQPDSTSGLALSPDGRTILRSAAVKTLQVWKAASTGEIEAWRKEEASVAEHLAARLKEKKEADERELAIRLSGQGAVLRWLVLPPIFPGDDADPVLPSEIQFKPRAGDRVHVGGRELIWKDVTLTNYVLNFNQVLGQPAEHCVFYAVSYLHAPRAMSGLRMRVALDDMGSVYLNGERIHHWVVQDYFRPDRDTITDVKLKAGVNVLVFKVINGPGGCEASARFTDEKGEPVLGFEARTTP